MTTSTLAQSFAGRALEAYEVAQRERLDRERQEWNEQQQDARRRITERFAEKLRLPPVTVTPATAETPGVEPGWFFGVESPWDAAYSVVVEGVPFVAWTREGRLVAIRQCSICKAHWREWCDYELVSIGQALATLHDCEEPGKKPPTEEGSPSSKLRNGAMGAVLGGPDSDNLAVIAHNLGVIAAELERFVDCGASMAGRGT